MGVPFHGEFDCLSPRSLRGLSTSVMIEKPPKKADKIDLEIVLPELTLSSSPRGATYVKRIVFSSTVCRFKSHGPWKLPRGSFCKENLPESWEEIDLEDPLYLSLSRRGTSAS